MNFELISKNRKEISKKMNNLYSLGVIGKYLIFFMLDGSPSSASSGFITKLATHPALDQLYIFKAV